MLAVLSAIGVAVGFIIKFIKSFLVKYVVHAVIISAQFAVTASTIAFVVLFYGFAITALVSIYNLGIDIFDYAQNGINGVQCFAGLVECIGLAGALQNGFTMLYASLSTIVIFHLFKFTLTAFRLIMNEVFKLGLLLGQAMN
ncbi:MAG: hypothetical protein GW821_19755 [Shewanella vesiculosa]|uniref:hypothetical protein n=1 Tax=Shewanella vesiculosa TaxID=518738 RepID=UPI000C6900A4|nr:hypothetical protein [Shewanella vesiculosa]PIS24487.1 MAG: hypothetical protein COT46_09125 [Sulfurimonas sp. CG08_land_8_20_14_0_20_36_33]PIU35714.1 MAG: hypothetical protein COT05_02230 [Sulfurimonas sp. CG07_land_8_20_14_0_80_36_56]PIV03034.1 MAG: hypothetical protein COS56_09980 [Sulfurimonas sp. CG03_land_8_20_14_0_80_36_25]PIV36589.1 MAG: hypothetical protein COS32_02070 [Sulfurimonas sp. CG02_land_8_20_14_3_00_36_67]PIV59785.1 MAG: hypothetical protein COS13_09335 [Sulfurimonas sp. 